MATPGAGTEGLRPRGHCRVLCVRRILGGRAELHRHQRILVDASIYEAFRQRFVPRPERWWWVILACAKPTWGR